ncbi:MAG: CPBP family intramembrane glutamic endopeptidase [Microbacterium gubbeenense]
MTALLPWAPRFLTVSGGVLAALVVTICLPFWLTDLDSEILSIATPALQWIPFVVILVVHLAMRPGVRFWRWSAIGVRPVARTIGSAGIALVVFVAVPLLTIVVASVLGLVEIAAVEGAATAALLVLPLSIVWMVFAFGEEIGWRGYLTSTLAPLGFWRSTLAIGAFWAAWHLPLTLTYALDGSMPLRDVVSTTINLLLAAVAIAAVRWFSGSVWPAVFAHAVMNTMGQFAYSNLITPLTSLDDGAYLAFYGVSWAVWAVVLVVLTRRMPVLSEASVEAHR